MLSITRIIFATIYLSSLVLALPKLPSKNQAIIPLPHNADSRKPVEDYTTSRKTIRLEDPDDECPGDLSKCGDVCYDPMDAECDTEFISITKFGPGIAQSRRRARQKAVDAGKLAEREVSDGSWRAERERGL
ncbi:hypothetical protein ABW19_dt0205895 [Dactylella cylindrospora]|nr:hypothetical protein ABW19_dt0205895 [Dactylella cylindrospora]